MLQLAQARSNVVSVTIKKNMATFQVLHFATSFWIISGLFAWSADASCDTRRDQSISISLLITSRHRATENNNLAFLGLTSYSAPKQFGSRLTPTEIPNQTPNSQSIGKPNSTNGHARFVQIGSGVGIEHHEAFESRAAQIRFEESPRQKQYCTVPLFTPPSPFSHLFVPTFRHSTTKTRFIS